MLGKQTRRCRFIFFSLFSLVCAIACSFFVKDYAITNALTNSIAIDGDIGYSLLAPSNQEISVSSEAIKFDYSDSAHNAYADNGSGIYYKMTADYDLANTGAAKTVQMGFPFLSSFTDIGLRDIKVLQDNNELEYQMLYGKRYEEYAKADSSIYMRSSDIDDLTLSSAIGQSLTKDGYIDKTMTVTKYSFRLDNVSTSRVALKFEAEPAKTTLLIDQDVGYKNYDFWKSGYNSIMISKYITPLQPNTYFSFSIVGQDIKGLKAYSADDNLINLKLIDDESLITRSVLNFKDEIDAIGLSNVVRYLTHYSGHEINGEQESIVAPFDEAMAISLFEKEVANKIGVSFCLYYDDVMSLAWNCRRINTIVFDVQLANGSGNNITITYPYSPGGDYRYEPPVFPFEYVSSPGKKWSSFGPITVTVVPPSGYYVVDSSIVFAKRSDGTYVSSLPGLPEKNISFKVCEGDRPERPFDDFLDFFSNAGKTLATIVVQSTIALTIVVGIPVGIYFIIRAKKRRRLLHKDDKTKK